MELGFDRDGFWLVEELGEVVKVIGEYVDV